MGPLQESKNGEVFLSGEIIPGIATKPTTKPVAEKDSSKPAIKSEEEVKHEGDIQIRADEKSENKKSEEDAKTIVTPSILKEPEEIITRPDQSQKVSSELETIDNRSVKLTVIRARKLEKQGMFDKGDPYVVLSYGKQMERSEVVKSNLNPDWNFETTFNITAGSPKEILLEVYDKDTVTKDDLMGRTSILISDIPKLRQGSWIPLKECKSGEVLLSADIISTPSIQPVVAVSPNVMKG